MGGYISFMTICWKGFINGNTENLFKKVLNKGFQKVVIKRILLGGYISFMTITEGFINGNVENLFYKVLNKGFQKVVIKIILLGGYISFMTISMEGFYK